ncbi:DUF5305 family protein [Neobacillus sp. SAB-20_R2A]|uniref:DUF5305 family protein n=1 Tax=Neobacillus sp. SAB-20_R2A TaxID=3120519 RepID=UPI003C6E5C3A
MPGTLTNMLKRYNKKLYTIIVILLVLSVGLTIYTFLQPATTTVQVNDNTSLIETGYDYKAEIIPNILYPNGGTVDAGKTIFKKITTAIPFSLKSTIHSKRQVTAKGTHEVQLIIKAGDVWERSFQLEPKRRFEQSGTEISVINDPYKIDLAQVEAFISQVEQETGITPDQYTLEVLPDIQGTIKYSGVEKPFQVQDRLIFQYSMEEIPLASEKGFTSMVSFTSSQVMTKKIEAFGVQLPLRFVRISSALLSIFLLVTSIYMIKRLKIDVLSTETLEIEIINKRYASRIIPVSQKINIAQKSIFSLDSFKSIIKISDEKELPIFFNKDHKEESAVFFIVDGDYLYTYETPKTNNSDMKKITGSDKAYARG